MAIPKNNWRATVVVPARNEALRLEKSLPYIKRWRDGHPNAQNIRLLLVNDGSSDSTADEARRMGFEVIDSHPADSKKSLGKTLAVRRGVEHADKNHKSDVVVLMDADLHYPEKNSINRILEPVVEGKHDMVVGSQAEGMYDVSVSNSGQRAIAMRALKPWLQSHEDWAFEEPWALEAMLNENIPRQEMRHLKGFQPEPDFYSAEPFRQSNEQEQSEQRRKVYGTIRARRAARWHK